MSETGAEATSKTTPGAESTSTATAGATSKTTAGATSTATAGAEATPGVPTAKKSRRGLLTALRVAAFCVALALAMGGVSGVFMNKTDAGYRVEDFYMLRENSLDAVYIGSSRVYAYWTPLFAFRDHGIAVYSLATAAQTIDAARYLIEEARKTQPNAVMIVNLATYRSYQNPGMHRVTDAMPLSATKLKFVNTVGERRGIRILDRAEYIFPMIIYHSRWKELTADDFLPETAGEYMGSSAYNSFFAGCMDLTEIYPAAVEQSQKVSNGTKEVLDELIDYCLENDVRLLFTLAPQAGVSEDELAERNGMRDYIRSRGVPVLDMQNSLTEIGLDLATDYTNERHTNIKGSAKFTEYVSQYLIANYGFADKRNDPAYADWRTALTKYETLIAEKNKAIAEGTLAADADTGTEPLLDD